MTSNKRGCEAQTPSLVPPIEASPLLVYSHFGRRSGKVKRPCHNLVSNVSTWLGPPYMNRKITLFARAGSAGFLGAIGLTNRETPSAADRLDPGFKKSRLRGVEANRVVLGRTRIAVPAQRKRSRRHHHADENAFPPGPRSCHWLAPGVLRWIAQGRTVEILRWILVQQESNQGSSSAKVIDVSTAFTAGARRSRP